MRAKKPIICERCNQVTYKSPSYFTPAAKALRKHDFCTSCGIEYNRERMRKWNIENNPKEWHRKTALRGNAHPLWKGLSRRNDGYYRITLETNTRKLYHRVIMEQFLGRPLEIHEVVHHKNGNPSDNCIENLLVTNRQEHMKYHAKGVSAPLPK